jgi:hypothetical protein
MPFAREQKILKKMPPRLWFSEIGLIKKVLKEQNTSLERSGNTEQAVQQRIIIDRFNKKCIGLTAKIDWLPSPTLAEAVSGYVARSNDLDEQVMCGLRIQASGLEFVHKYVEGVENYSPQERLQESVRAMQILQRISPEDYEAILIEQPDNLPI